MPGHLKVQGTDKDGEVTKTSIPKQTPMHLMLVDDNSLILDTLGDQLRSLGHHVSAFSSAIDALAAIEKEKPDILIVDVQMPGIDGLEMIRRVRALRQKWALGLSIMALTALAMPGDEKRCKDAGANFYLTKPVSISRLASALDVLRPNSLPK